MLKYLIPAVILLLVFPLVSGVYIDPVVQDFIDSPKDNSVQRVARASIEEKTSQDPTLLSVIVYTESADISALEPDRINHVYPDEAGFSGNLTANEIIGLLEKGDVISIHYNDRVYAFLDESTELIGAKTAWQTQISNQNLTGAGQTVCVIDSGIDASHILFQAPGKIVAVRNTIIDSENVYDGDGHGTHVAGIVAASGVLNGTAPGASLAIVKALDDEGSGSFDDVAEGIYWCISNKDLYNISVITMSLGEGGYTDFCPTSAIYAPIQSALNNNLAVVAASGNSNRNNMVANPACVPGVIRVGATTKSDEVWQSTFTSGSDRWGLGMVFAPGVDILSAFPGDYVAILNGTSMAAPHVAGAIAILQQYGRLDNTSLSPNEIERILNATGVQISDGVRNYSRITITDALSAVSLRRGSGTVDDPFMIYDCYDLQNINLNLSAHYMLANNIDCSVSREWNDGQGFEPIALIYDEEEIFTYSFSGTLDGAGFNITGLYINRPNGNYMGLFSAATSDIVNVRLLDANITGNYLVTGGLVAFQFGGSISNIFASGVVNGTNYVGGLVGIHANATLSNSSFTGSVQGSGAVGGLVGGLGDGSVSDSFANGSVQGSVGIGGLVGYQFNGTLSNSSFTGIVNGSEFIGGSIGLSYGLLDNVSVNATVTGLRGVGGIAGGGGSLSRFSNSSFIGSLVGEWYVGGISGVQVGSEVFSSYAIANITGTSWVGGIFGGEFGSVIKNTVYDLNATFFNGVNKMTPGAIPSHLFQDWLSNRKFLNISQYLVAENNSFVISNKSDLDMLAVFGQIDAYNFILNSSIAVNSEYTIPYFIGNLDGQHHTLSNIAINTSPTAGFIGSSHGNISNLTVENITVFGSDLAGGLVASNFGEIFNVAVTGNVTGGFYTGGLIGLNHNNLSDSSFIGTLEHLNISVPDISIYSDTSATSLSNLSLSPLLTFDSISPFVDDFLPGSRGGIVGDSYGTFANSFAIIQDSFWCNEGVYFVDETSIATCDLDNHALTFSNHSFFFENSSFNFTNSTLDFAESSFITSGTTLAFKDSSLLATNAVLILDNSNFTLSNASFTDSNLTITASGSSLELHSENSTVGFNFSNVSLKLIASELHGVQFLEPITETGPSIDAVFIRDVNNSFVNRSRIYVSATLNVSPEATNESYELNLSLDENASVLIDNRSVLFAITDVNLELKTIVLYVNDSLSESSITLQGNESHYSILGFDIFFEAATFNYSTQTVFEGIPVELGINAGEYPRFDRSAEIFFDFRGFKVTNGSIIRNGVICNESTIPACTLDSQISGGFMTLLVPSWSTYAVNGSFEYVCGNNQVDIEAGEACDGSDFGDLSCSSFENFNRGTLACSANCKVIDSSNCYFESSSTGGGGGSSRGSGQGGGSGGSSGAMSAPKEDISAGVWLKFENSSAGTQSSWQNISRFNLAFPEIAILPLVSGSDVRVFFRMFSATSFMLTSSDAISEVWLKVSSDEFDLVNPMNATFTAQDNIFKIPLGNYSIIEKVIPVEVVEEPEEVIEEPREEISSKESSSFLRYLFLGTIILGVIGVFAGGVIIFIKKPPRKKSLVEELDELAQTSFSYNK